MTIRKFQSNASEVLEKIPIEDRGSFLQIGDTEVSKTLGLNWMPDTREKRANSNHKENRTFTNCPFV